MCYIIKALETLIVVSFLNYCYTHELSLKNLKKTGEGLNDDFGSTHEDSGTKLSPHPDEKKHESGPNIETILEEQYRFRNDESTKRYRISNEDRQSPDTSSAQNMALFRAFTGRRIVGGMETSINVYPYNVAISRNNKHWCGGSVIDEQWVLTAGHCFESAIDGDRRKLQNFIVRAGSSFHGRGGYQARVNKAFFPINYAVGSADYDFCLVRLDRPLPIGRNIAVLNLPASDFALRTDDIIIVTGWGSTDESGYGHIPDRIRFVPVPVMSKENCQNSYRFYITKRMLCAGYATGGKDACNHDSGGPAVRDGVLVGIVSFGGKQCGDPSSPGVYSRVSQITEWVDDTITSNEASLVPELQAKIEKARKRESELKRFKARVEDKKNKIKKWLRLTLKSPKFLKLAKRKLKEAGINTAKTRRLDKLTNINEKEIDEANLYNMINERVLQADRINNEADFFLRMVAMQEIINGNSGEEFDLRTNNSDESMESVMAYLAK